MSFARPLLVVSTAFFAACSGPSAMPSAAASASTTSFVDAVDPALVPQLIGSGGPVIVHPRFVPVSFLGDPNAADMESIVAGVAGSESWAAATSEYGVGAATTSNPVHVTERPPSTLTMALIANWLTEKLDGSHSEWPLPDPNTVYALFYPPGTTITDTFGFWRSCDSFGGYHQEVMLPNAVKVTYVVIPRCETFPGLSLSGLDIESFNASHEMIEAVTDPNPTTAPAYKQIDDWSWGQFGEETGDICRFVVAPNSQAWMPSTGGHLFQRTWSNAAMKAGHSPCVPAPKDEVYFNAIPALDEYVDIPGKTTEKVRAVRIPAGGSRTIDVKLFSDGPTSGPWVVTGVDGFSSPILAGGGGDPVLGFSFDRDTGVNGDVLHLTIRFLAPPPKDGKYAPFLIQSKLGDKTNSWFGTVVL